MSAVPNLLRGTRFGQHAKKPKKPKKYRHKIPQTTTYQQPTTSQYRRSRSLRESIINNQSSIINKKTTPPLSRRRHDDAETIDHPQSTTESPKPPSILPILPPNKTPSAQNKPNRQNPKTDQTSYTTKSYTNIPPRQDRKNKPNQTQSPRPRTRHDIRYTTYNIERSPDSSGMPHRDTKQQT